MTMSASAPASAKVSDVEIGCPEAAHHLWFAAFGDPVKHVGLVAPLGGQQRGEKPDRPGAGDEDLFRCPCRPVADLFDVVPGLCHDGGGLEQHAENPEDGIHRNEVLGVDTVALGGVAVTALDAPLGVPAVHAHIPVPRCARRTRNRVAPADDADDQVSGTETGPRGCLDHPAERFVPDDEAVLTRWRRPVVAVDDLQIGAADADRLRLDQNRPVLVRGLRHLGQCDGALLRGNDGDGPHGLTIATELLAVRLPARRWLALAPHGLEALDC